MVGIYKITSPTNKVYIGRSWDLDKRESKYRRLQCLSQHKIYNSIKKYGWESHKFEVLLNVSLNIPQKIFDVVEQQYINFYKKSGVEMMNLRDAGTNGKHYPESIKRMSEAQKKIKGTPENRAHMSKMLKGRKQPPAWFAKMIGRPVPIHIKEKLSKIKKGKPTYNSKPLIQLSLSGDFIREWPYLKVASKELGIPNINRSIKYNLTAGGFRWKYKDNN